MVVGEVSAAGLASCSAAGVVVVIVVDGAVALDGHALQPLDALLLEDGETLRLDGTGVVVTAAVKPPAPPGLPV